MTQTEKEIIYNKLMEILFVAESKNNTSVQALLEDLIEFIKFIKTTNA
jgi:hypothetical protein